MCINSPDSSNPAQPEKVDGTFVVPVADSSADGETIARPRSQSSSENPVAPTDKGSAESDEGERSLSLSVELSNGPRVAVFRSERGVVPLTAIERLQLIVDQLREIDAPGILTIQSVDPLDEGCQVVMSPVSGSTLTQLLESRQPSWQESLRLIIHLVEALVPVHQEGLAHGGLNASRIFLRNLQLTKIADFGLCLFFSDSTDASSKEALACLAPENSGGQKFPLTPQMDVYSIGVLLYRLVCGRYPFRSESSIEVQRQICEDAPQPPRQLFSEIPREVEQLCLQCLAKNPADRPASAKKLWKTLSRLLVDDEQAASQSVDDSVSQSASKRLITRQSSSVERVMLIETQPRNGLVLETLADVHEHLGVLPERWSGDGLLFLLPPSSQRSDWSVAFADRVLRCLSAVAKEQKKNESPGSSPDQPIRLLVSSARIHARPDRTQPANADGLNGQVLRLEATVSNGHVDVCHRGGELLTRSLYCTESRREERTPDAWRYRLADRDGSTLTVRVTGARKQLPLSGRSSQLAILKSRWEQACEGMGQIVLLLGDEGMGKTRMVRELMQHVTQPGSDKAESGRSIVWNCRPHQQGQSLHPLLYWLRHSHDDFEDGNGDDTLESRVASLLDGAETSVSEAEHVLGSVLGMSDSSFRVRSGLSATQRREQSCQVLLDWLSSQATDSPLLFVVEDLQWIDPTTLRFLTLLVDRGFNDRIMTLLTFRSEFETPWGSRAHQTQVALNRLTKRHAKALITAATDRADDVSSELVAEILQHTEGNPLYIEAAVADSMSRWFPNMGL